MVMTTIAAGEFKAKCLGIIDQVGETRQEVLITKRGKPVARLVPVEAEKFDDWFGRMKGTGRIVGDIFTTDEVWEADQ